MPAAEIQFTVHISRRSNCDGTIIHMETTTLQFRELHFLLKISYAAANSHAIFISLIFVSRFLLRYHSQRKLASESVCASTVGHGKSTTVHVRDLLLLLETIRKFCRCQCIFHSFHHYFSFATEILFMAHISPRKLLCYYHYP